MLVFFSGFTYLLIGTLVNVRFIRDLIQGKDDSGHHSYHFYGYIFYSPSGLSLYAILWVLFHILKTGPTRNFVVCGVILSSLICVYMIWVFSSCPEIELCPWQTGSWPQTFRGCSARVNVQQVPLFAESIYQTQFSRVRESRNPWSNFDMEQSLRIRSNETLCGQGFQR